MAILDMAVLYGCGGRRCWQTRRADDVARSIRRAERREKGLLSLNATVASIQTELDRLYRQSERGQTPFSIRKRYGSLANLRCTGRQRRQVHSGC